jgi:hypothetical protein
VALVAGMMRSHKNGERRVARSIREAWQPLKSGARVRGRCDGSFHALSYADDWPSYRNDIPHPSDASLILLADIRPASPQ